MSLCDSQICARCVLQKTVVLYDNWTNKNFHSTPSACKNKMGKRKMLMVKFCEKEEQSLEG